MAKVGKAMPPMWIFSLEIGSGMNPSRFTTQTKSIRLAT